MQPADNRPVHTSGSEAASDSTFRAVLNLFCQLEAESRFLSVLISPGARRTKLSDLPPPSTATRKRQHTPERIGKTAARFAERREAPGSIRRANRLCPGQPLFPQSAARYDQSMTSPNDQPPAIRETSPDYASSQPVSSSFKQLYKKKKMQRDWAEIVPIALRMIATGCSAHEASRRLHIPMRSLYDRLESPAWCAQYARAQTDRAAAVAENAMKQADRTDVDPALLRVRIDTYKWFAARMDPKRWGERLPPPKDMDTPEAMGLDQLAASIAALEGQTGLLKRVGIKITQTVELAAQVGPADHAARLNAAAPALDDDEPL